MAPLSTKIEVKLKMHSTLNFQLRFSKIKLCFLGLSSSGRTAHEHNNHTLLYPAVVFRWQLVKTFAALRSLSKLHVAYSSFYIRVQCLQSTQCIHYWCLNTTRKPCVWNLLCSVQSSDKQEQTPEWFSPLPQIRKVHPSNGKWSTFCRGNLSLEQGVEE